MARIDQTGAPVAEKSVESSASAVEWASIFGGALAAFGFTIILLTLGPGLGLATVSPWFFRDTAHGLLAWALATLLIALLVTLGSAATAGVAAAAASSPSGTPVSPEAADQARKIAVAFAFTTSLSLLIGAFAASAAGALGGFHRDEA